MSKGSADMDSKAGRCSTGGDDCVRILSPELSEDAITGDGDARDHSVRGPTDFTKNKGGPTWDGDHSRPSGPKPQGEVDFTKDF